MSDGLLIDRSRRRGIYGRWQHQNTIATSYPLTAPRLIVDVDRVDFDRHKPKPFSGMALLGILRDLEVGQDQVPQAHRRRFVDSQEIPDSADLPVENYQVG